MKPRRRIPTRYLLGCLLALYAPSTPRKRAEAAQLAAEHCARVERGVRIDPAAVSPPLPDLFDEGGTSGRCPRAERTPAGRAGRTRVAGATGGGDLPPGDLPPHSDAA